MADLYAEQWGLTLLVSFLVTWGVVLAPPLLIRLVLMRRPIGKGWAVGVVALFGLLNFALFIALGSQSKPHAALVLVAIVSYLILTTGKKEKAAVYDQSQLNGPKVTFADPVATSQDVRNKNKGNFSNDISRVCPADTVSGLKSMNVKTEPSNGTSLSKSEEEAELRRYEIAWRELETGDPHRGLWARAFVKAEGDKNRAKVQYLKERTEYLKKVEQRQEEQRKARELRHQQIQEQMEHQRKERMEKSNKEMRIQKEERQHQDLIKQISLERREKVNMLRDGVNKPDKWNEFKLISAAQFESDEHVLALLAAGANPLLRDSFGHTARDYAKQKGRSEIVEHLAVAERLWKQKR